MTTPTDEKASRFAYAERVPCGNPDCGRGAISKGYEPEGWTLDVTRLLDKPLLVIEATRLYACKPECIGPAVIAATRYDGEDDDESGT